MNIITTNLVTNLCSVTNTRFVEIRGIVLKPGTFTGSAGTLTYTVDMLKSSAKDWKGVPILLGHPSLDDYELGRSGLNALQKIGIGFIRDAYGDEQGNLCVVGYIDLDRIKSLANNTLDLTRAIEVSTGFTTSSIIRREGQAYPEDIHPDHIALLLDQPGACSMTEGCGVKIVAQQSNDDSDDVLLPPEQESRAKALEQKISDIIKDLTEEDWELGRKLAAWESQGNLVVNPPSWVEDEAAWRRAKRLARKGGYSGDSFWAVTAHIYRNIVAYQSSHKGGTSMELKTNQAPETVNSVHLKDLAKLLGVDVDPAEDPVGFINQIKDHLQSILTRLEVKSGSNGTASTTEATEAVTESNQKSVQQSKCCNSSWDHDTHNWLRNAPEYVRRTLERAESLERQKRQELVDKIIANAKLSEDSIRWLKRLAIDDLERVSTLVQDVVTNSRRKPSIVNASHDLFRAEQSAIPNATSALEPLPIPSLTKLITNKQ